MHISDLLGLVPFCCEDAEPANGGLEQHVPDGCAVLCSESFCLWGVSAGSHTGIDSLRVGWRVGWQQGDQLVCLRCQQHLTLPAQFVTGPNSVEINTWGKCANALQSPNMLCERCFLFFDLIEFVCVSLHTRKSVCLCTYCHFPSSTIPAVFCFPSFLLS